MPDSNLVTGHYTHGTLEDALRQGIARLGKTTESITIDDLAPVDEFHIGGRLATAEFLDQLDIDASHRVLDVGCGLGGASRFAASRYGCHVNGVDLTGEYVQAGNAICSWLGLDKRIQLEVADATRLPHPANAFQRVYMLHVGMNIADKAALAGELYRVTEPGGRVGIYDVMRDQDGELAFPVPWAADPRGSSVAPAATYRRVLEDAGFRIRGERNRREFALEFFAQLQARTVSADGPPPLGLHILMGNTAPAKLRNMVANISRGLIAPVEIIADKPA